MNVAFDMHFSGASLIDNRNIPTAYSTQEVQRPLFTGGIAASLLISFLADGLLVSMNSHPEF